MCQYLGISLGYELIPLILHLFLQGNIVLDNAVVYHGNGSRIVHMRMGIDIAGSSVSCPTRMSDTGGSFHILSAVGQVLQNLKSSHCLSGVDLLTVKNRHTCGIISTVFQLGQTVQNDRCCLFCSNITYNTTHSHTSFLFCFQYSLLEVKASTHFFGSLR